MPATIKIKNSSTASAVPTSSDLVQGELAVNVTDRRIFTENASGTVVELGTNPTILTMGAAGSASAPVITRTGDTNTGMFFPAADTIAFAEGGTETLRLDSSGNMGLGVTPSTWNTGKALEINAVGTSLWGAFGNTYLNANYYYNAGDKFAGTGRALQYLQVPSTGAHIWNTSTASGTAGGAVTFTQAMTLDASGNLGIGTTSPSYRLTAAGASTAGSVTALAIENPSTNAASEVRQEFRAGGTTWAYLTSSYNSNSPYLAFGVNSAERARIDSSGSFLVGTTSAVSLGAATGVQAYQAGYLYATVSGDAAGGFARRGSDGQVVIFRRDTTGVGSISVTGSSTAYNTSSDYRLKENIAPMTGALEKVAALKPVTYTWKSDGSNGEGFIAHELAEVCSQAVLGEKDAVDADGNPVYQGIDTSFLVATLTAAIQELKAELDAAKARITALEA